MKLLVVYISACELLLACELLFTQYIMTLGMGVTC